VNPLRRAPRHGKSAVAAHRSAGDDQVALCFREQLLGPAVDRLTASGEPRSAHFKAAESVELRLPHLGPYGESVKKKNGRTHSDCLHTVDSVTARSRGQSLLSRAKMDAASAESADATGRV